MTRRRIIFKDCKNRMYITAEYNGDKSELEERSAKDCCDKNWDEILQDFEDVRTVEDFVTADLNAQQHYHNSDIILGRGDVVKFDFEYFPIEKFFAFDNISADEIYLIENGKIQQLKEQDEIKRLF